jgi:pimeloyl-ACP methyl ester carboxylesterase/tellurite resistance protein
MIDINADTKGQWNYLQQIAEIWGLGLASGQLPLLSKLSKHHGAIIARSQTEAARAAAEAMQKVMPQLAAPEAAKAYSEYVRDFGQRWVLYLDTLCQRGDAAIAREKQGSTPVLAFDYDMVIDGRELERPVNYALVRIRPPQGTIPPREDGRPWVIIDPRAGHGSGIGGFKSESEVGVALKEGHPVYFVIFYRDPEPGQTLADVCEAEATFLREVQTRHPHSPKPLVTGNCQGGWAAMILAATHPGLMGPVVIAGAPLSYWAGKRGLNPFRYLGGIVGGAVPALLTADLGGGKFDGANLVQNFESLNPGKTWFRKNFDLLANVDDEAERYLEFERWWSGFYLMNECEIRWIVENLFVGNKLTRGEAVLDDGTPIDLKRIEAPIIVFASHGDNITPPQQALNWIPDLYASAEEVEAHGHVIIYTLHESVGHLGIFVSAQVARKEHEQIGSIVKTIESMAPGLYEMLISKDEQGQYTVVFESRTIDDILALDDDREEEVEFAAVAKLSEWATKTYELTWQPIIRAMVTPEMAEARKQRHPLRQKHRFFSHQNPMFSKIGETAAQALAERTPAASDNPFVGLEQIGADLIEHNWNLYRDIRDAGIELAFHAFYGTPWMKQLGASSRRVQPTAHDIRKIPHVQEALGRIKAGGYAEGVIRMLILLSRARGSVRSDRLERSNAVLHSRPPFSSMTPEARAHAIYEQSLIVELTGNQAITTLADLLNDPADRYRALNLVLDVAGPIEEMDAPTIAMFKRLQVALHAAAHDWREPVAAAPETGSPATGEMPAARPDIPAAPPHTAQESAA